MELAESMLDGPLPPMERSGADADELLVDELVGREQAHLARGAGALDAAERQLGRVGEDEVDVDHAGVDLVGDARGLLLVGREDVRAEAEAACRWRSPTASSSSATR